MYQLFWICLGGAVGTGARYLVSGWALALAGPGFPYGTLVVNVAGSLLLGGVVGVGLAADEWLGETARLALSIGVAGGFTTFSTFSFETARLLQDGALGLALVNVLGNLLACVAATFLGLAAARWALATG